MNQRHLTKLNTLLLFVGASGLLALLAGCPTVPPECASDADCDDALFCNGVESCDDGACVSSGDPCSPAETCDEQSDACTTAPCDTDADCDDDLFCNGAELCIDGRCESATDGYPLGRWGGTCVLSSAGTCTAELVYATPTSGTLMTSTGLGEFTQSGPLVPGGSIVITVTAPASYVSEHRVIVSPNGFCMSGPWSDNQGNSGTAERCWLEGVLPCAGDACNEETGSCTPQPECTNNADCDDTLFCNGAETCLDGQCQGGAAPCVAGETCAEDTESCPPPVCTTNADCNDADACTTDTCVDSTCANVAVVCDAAQTCNGSTGVCQPTCAVDSDCDDTLFCSGAETCVDGFCQAGAAPCAVGEACDEDARECTTSGSLPFFDDFEGGIGNWFADNGIWEVGVPTSGPNSAHSPENVAATVLAGDYPDGTSSRLVSPSIQLPAIVAGGELHLRFWHWFTFAGGGSCLGCYGDSGVVQIREQTAPGQWGTWTSLNTFAGSSGVYTNALVDLSGYAGTKVQVGFLLSQGPWAAAAGWYIDDITIDVF